MTSAVQKWHFGPSAAILAATLAPMNKLLITRRLRAAVLVSGLVLGGLVAGCGSSSKSSHPQGEATTPAAFKSPGADPLVVPAVTQTMLEHGSAQQEITEAIVAFYRAAWEGNSTQACAMFTPTGAAGFLHAAATEFPQSVNGQSTCEHAMDIYNAALGDSASTTEDNDTSFSPDMLDNVGVAGIRVTGSSATAIAPTNVADLINPERFYLDRTGKQWLINGSTSLNATNLPKILSTAKAKGELTPKHAR